MRTLALATMIGMHICIPVDQLYAQEVRAMAVSAASADGFGGFMDYIHKLSGPEFTGGGGSFTSGRWTGSPPNYQGNWRVRLSFTGYWHEDSKYITSSPSPDTASIKMLTLEGTAELGHRRAIGVLGPFAAIPEIGGGIAVHKFSADNPAIKGFYLPSVPLYAQLRLPIVFVRLPFTLTIKGRFGMRIFPPFPKDAFSATSTPVIGHKWESPWFKSIGVQVNK